jgi:hypothetical protein
MFERDYIGMTPDTLIQQLPGRVAPARHALARQRYSEEKRLRLTAEAKVRRHHEPMSPWRIAVILRGLMTKIAPSATRCSVVPPDAAEK